MYIYFNSEKQDIQVHEHIIIMPAEQKTWYKNILWVLIVFVFRCQDYTYIFHPL